MKKQLLASLLLIAVLPLAVFAQKGKKLKSVSILASTSFNISTPLKPYAFKKEYYVKDEKLILKFLTENSGIFAIKEGDSIRFQTEIDTRLSSQIVGLGASVQFRSLKNAFQEITLSRLSYAKSHRFVNYAITYADGEQRFWKIGHVEKAFAAGLRYEVGKYFGKKKKAPVRFGLSFGIEPSFLRYKFEPLTSQAYPMRANLFTIDVALIPMVSAKIAKPLWLDFKVVPNFLIADFGKFTLNDPNLPLPQQIGARNYTSPDMTWALSVQLRYMVKQAKKKRKKE